MKRFFLGLILLFLGATHASALETYTFNCKDSAIQGQIKYAVIGTYHFSFEECQGQLTYDPLRRKIDSVDVQIKVDSITSNCPWCDDIATSRRLLNTARFPWMSYHSRSFSKVLGEPQVHGLMTVHGMTRPLNSGFSLEPAPHQLIVKGQWLIRRRLFNLIWSKVLDHGGVVVGEIVKIDWTVHARRVT